MREQLRLTSHTATLAASSASENRDRAAHVILRAGIAYSVAVGVTALFEGLLVRGAAPAGQLVEMTLGTLVGGLTGLAAGAVSAASEAAGRVRRAVIVLLAGALGVWLAQYMGTIAALSGRARGFAGVLLVIAVAGSMGFAALLIRAAEAPAYPSGARRRIKMPLRAAASFVSGVAALFTAHWLVPPYHRAVQDVIACGGAVLLGFAFHTLQSSVLFSRRLFLAASLGWAAAIFASAFLLSRPQGYERARLDDIIIARAGFKLQAYATDVDGDGYSSLFGGGDCAPWNSLSHPGATEIPDNGVDDNCSWGDAPRPVEHPVPAVRATPPSPMSVALITIDTVRWDRVGVSGYSPSPTPNLDAWARAAKVFERAYAASTRTCSSLAALHYGHFPRGLRWARGDSSSAVQRLRDRLPDAELRPRWMCVTDEVGAHGQKTLAEWLKARGMGTAAAVNDNGSYLIEREFFGAGFDIYRDTLTGEDGEVVGAAIGLLEELTRGEPPFFLWVHLLGAHERGSSQRLRDTGKEYDAALAQTDAALRPLLTALEVAGTRAPLGVVIASDHGELMGPNRRWHGSDLSDELLRVPLLIRAPSLSPGRTRILSSTVDIMPTVLALTDTPAPSGLPGINLAATPDEERRAPLLSDVWVRPLGIDLTAAYDGERKVVYSHESRTYTLFSQVPGAAALPGEDSALRQRIQTYLTENDLNPIH